MYTVSKNQWISHTEPDQIYIYKVLIVGFISVKFSCADFSCQTISANIYK